MSKKMIIELSEEQHKDLVDYASRNNSTKTDVVRYFCDALKGLDFDKTHIIMHDDKTVKTIGIIETVKSDKKSLAVLDCSERKDIKRLESRIFYEQGKPLISDCLIVRENRTGFGGVELCINE